MATVNVWFDRNHPPTGEITPAGLAINFPLAPYPDPAWCWLFGGVDLIPALQWAESFRADQGGLRVELKWDIPKGQLWEVLDWAAKSVRATNAQRQVQASQAQKLQSLVESWWKELPSSL